jgi:hypothetical protein
MKATRIILAAAAAALIAAPAFATEAAKSEAPAMSKRAVAKWTALDTDKDGFISKDEWSAEELKKFDAKDTDHDGKISKEEFASRKSMKHKEVAKKEAAPAASGAKEETPATTAPAAGDSEAPAKE